MIVINGVLCCNDLSWWHFCVCESHILRLPSMRHAWIEHCDQLLFPRKDVSGSNYLSMSVYPTVVCIWSSKYKAVRFLWGMLCSTFVSLERSLWRSESGITKMNPLWSLMSPILCPVSCVLCGKTECLWTLQRRCSLRPLTTQLGFRSKWSRTCQYAPLHISVFDKCVNVVEK